MLTLRRTAAAFMVAAGLLALTPTSAHAGPDSLYRGQCGSGYRLIDWNTLGPYAASYLTWNGTTGKNCMVTQRNHIGTDRVYLLARISVYGGSEQRSDSGYYTSHAGPLYVSAVGRCINWSGSAYGYVFAEAKVHCD